MCQDHFCYQKWNDRKVFFPSIFADSLSFYGCRTKSGGNLQNNFLQIMYTGPVSRSTL